jgi:transposase
VLPAARHQEFLAFLKQVAKAYPRTKLHLVVDNYATHKHPSVQAWLARNPRITLLFTPTSGSWLNMVEIFFGIITRQAIRRGTFTSVKDLIAAIGNFIDGWNDRCKPFQWTKDADYSTTVNLQAVAHPSRTVRRLERRRKLAPSVSLAAYEHITVSPSDPSVVRTRPRWVTSRRRWRGSAWPVCRSRRLAPDSSWRGSSRPPNPTWRSPRRSRP